MTRRHQPALVAGRRCLLVLIVLWALGWLPVFAGEPSPGTENVPPLARLIREAGESESDAERLLRLRELAQQVSAAGASLPGLDRLISFVERWQSPRIRLNFFRREVLETLDFDFGVPADSPLRPIADFYLARMICWVTLEYSEIYPVAERRGRALGRARVLFATAQRAFPENRIIGMYLGVPLMPEKEYGVPVGAPRWAVAQREGLERLTDIIEWWVEHRLRVGGDYGGGWGDDCELWRSWTPILIGFSHPRIAWAQEVFSRRLLEQPHLVNGYHAERLDVEHGAEDVSDALTPMMFLAPDDPDWVRRIHRLVDLSEGLWMGRNQRGQLQFKSAYFSATEVDPQPERACDTVYHPRALQPALLYWQRTGDERIGRLVADWMRTWVDAAARSEKGKPAGILPSALHWPDGSVGGAGPKWWLPGVYETSLYDFPGAMGLLLNTLALTAHLTGDATYLQPLRTMAEVRREWLRAGEPPAPAGTRLWCGANLGQLAGPAAKVRFSSGDPTFDDLLRAEEEPYVHFRLGASLDSTVAALERLAGTLRVNFPSFTSEVRFTDRMLRFPVLYQAGWMLPEGGQDGGSLLEGGLVRRGFNGVHLLYHTVTGDPGDPLYFPSNAVRWHTEPRNLAALVVRAEPRRLEARLYHFGLDARRFEVECLTLAPGEYRLELRPLDTGSGGVQELRFRVSAKERRTVVNLPSRRECQLIVQTLP